MRELVLVSVVAGSCALGACSSSTSPAAPAPTDDAGADAASDDAGDEEAQPAPYPAPHPAMPQVLTMKGPVVKAPKVVPIVFQGDSLASDIATFMQQIVADTAYWSGATAEYGVGALTATAPITINETPASSLSDTDVQAWLTNKIANDVSFPKPDANTIYAIFYPDGVTISLQGAPSCQAFGGYHNDFSPSAGSYVSYAIMPRCPPDKHAPKTVTVLDQLTATTSHELIEAATDPLPQDQPAYSQLDADHQGWLLLVGGAEIGDVCAPFPGVFYKRPGITTLVQRVWSNQAAAASHDPCEPNGASPYFNSAPVLPDSIVVDSPMGGTVKTKGVRIPIGQTKTIELDLYSDAPASGPWKVTVEDVTSKFTGSQPALALTLDKSEGQNGDKLQLTIKALTSSPLGAAPFWIQNDLGGATTVWLGVVAN